MEIQVKLTEEAALKYIEFLNEEISELLNRLDDLVMEKKYSLALKVTEEIKVKFAVIDGVICQLAAATPAAPIAQR